MALAKVLWRLPAFLLLQQALGEFCVDDPEVDVITLTKENCTCCGKFEDFVFKDYAVVMTTKTGAPKAQVSVDSFFKGAKDWKYSRVHFGQVDADKDPDYASQKVYIAQQFPIFSFYHQGETLQADKKVADEMEKHYQAGNMEMFDFLKPLILKAFIDKRGSDLEHSDIFYADHLEKDKDFIVFRKKHKTAVVGMFNRLHDKWHMEFSKAIWSMAKSSNDKLPPGFGFAYSAFMDTFSNTIPNVKRKVGFADVPAVAAWVDGKRYDFEVPLANFTSDSILAWLTSEIPQAKWGVQDLEALEKTHPEMMVDAMKELKEKAEIAFGKRPPKKGKKGKPHPGNPTFIIDGDRIEL